MGKRGKDWSDPAGNPCIGVCRFDAAGACKGCFRTKAETRRWRRMDAEERAAINRRVRPLMAFVATVKGPSPKRARKLAKRIARLEAKLERLRAELGSPSL
ncbi:MAG TPA: DUF1289 domain-containing protein [Azospirillaceae bacterium]|nr:DUF1289 domain-containing protein [Azospirillaceae bacterium]